MFYQLLNPFFSKWFILLNNRARITIFHLNVSKVNFRFIFLLSKNSCLKSDFHLSFFDKFELFLNIRILALELPNQFFQLLQRIFILSQRNITIRLPVITLSISGIQSNGLIGVLDRQSVILHLDVCESTVRQVDRRFGRIAVQFQCLSIILNR
jgi:hypothetical protein